MKMFEETGCFDQQEAENGFSQVQTFPMDEHSFPHQNQQDLDPMDLQHQVVLQAEMQNLDHHQAHFVHQEMVHEASNWQEMNAFNNNENPYNNQAQAFTSILPETPYPTTPDLLNIFPLPRCSPSSLINPGSSLTFSNSSSQKSPSLLASLGLLGDINPAVAAADGSSSGVVYDPLLPLNLPPQPPLLRELFHSLPQHGGGFGVVGGVRGSNGTLFGGVDEMNGGGLYGDHEEGMRQFDQNGVFEFRAGEMDCLGKNRDGKETKHFATERHRRVLLNDKYHALRKLIPQPTKNDRASIVQDAIEYINELKRCATEIQVMLEQKRCARERRKRPKADDEATEGKDSKSDINVDNPFNGSPLRSSWLHRKSKTTEVDVRIVDDEVTVKLVQQKRINCLLSVSRALDELQLDLHHVAGGLIGDYYSFLFNSKICEGSIVYASAIANKLIEVVDKAVCSHSSKL